MRLPASVLLVSMLTLGCHSQTHASNEMPANIIIPDPPPSAPIEQWRADSGRTPVSFDLHGATVRGFRYDGTDPNAPTLLFFNGNGMTVLRADALYRRLAELGPSVVVYDYRGYGFSGGKPDLMTYRNDALLLYDRAAASAPGHRVVVYGYSMGTTAASYIASERPVAALILAAPIGSAEEEFPVYAKLIGYSTEFIQTHKPSADAKLIFGEVALVARSKAPLLVLHGTADFLIPVEQSREVLSASPSPSKRLVELPGADHNATPEESASFDAISQLLHDLQSH